MTGHGPPKRVAKLIITHICITGLVMARYYRHTRTMFWQSFTLGTAFAGAWFLFYPGSLDNRASSWVTLRFVPLFKVAVFFAPTVVLFSLLCIVNVLLIRLFASEELSRRRANIMEKLLDSAVSKNPLIYHCTDLLDRSAWKSLRLFWRYK